MSDGTLKTGIAGTDREHCSELAMLPGSLFEFTSRFLPVAGLESLLAVYALKQAVGTIPDIPVDDAVKWAKLKWWSEEFAANPESPSRHPVLRVLWLSGARRQIDNALLQTLIRDALIQIDIAPDSDETAMFERLAELGTTEIRLELALENAEIGKQSLNYLGAATRLYREISGFGNNLKFATRRIPLSILAKYNVSVAQLEQQLRPPELSKIIEQFAADALEWFSKGLSGLEIISMNGASAGACTHLQLRWAMEKRRLAVIRKDVSGFLDTGKCYGPADAWFAWRFLRRLN